MRKPRFRNSRAGIKTNVESEWTEVLRLCLKVHHLRQVRPSRPVCWLSPEGMRGAGVRHVGETWHAGCVPGSKAWGPEGQCRAGFDAEMCVFRIPSSRYLPARGTAEGALGATTLRGTAWNSVGRTGRAGAESVSGLTPTLAHGCRWPQLCVGPRPILKLL